MSLSWVACSAVDGTVLAELPGLSVDAVSVVMGSYTTANAALPIATAPVGWVRATLQGATFLVLLDDRGDGTPPVPVWGGLVLRRRRGLGDEAQLTLITVEGYLDRRYVGDREFTNTPQTQIVRQLVEEFVTGFPIRVQETPSTTRRDRKYEDASDKTVFSVLTELSGVAGGPEWAVGWERRTGPVRYTPVLFTADRLGTNRPAGMAPAATFEAPGSVTSAEFVEDFGAGKGATDVMAVSTASQGVRPQSPHQTSADPERPPFEHRFTPSTSISEVSTLTAHAQSALAQMLDGAQALTLTAAHQAAPALGRDWFVGDDIGYRLGRTWTSITGLFPGMGLYPSPTTYPRPAVEVVTRTVPAFPEGLAGVARCIGWTLGLRDQPVTVTPILATEEA